MKKLTLSADPEVIEQAKRLAAESGTSISSMFERFIRLMSRKGKPRRRLGPITQEASGLISLPRGKIMVAGSFLYPVLYGLAVVGGTDTYAGGGGSMTVRQFPKTQSTYWLDITLR